MFRCILSRIQLNLFFKMNLTSIDKLSSSFSSFLIRTNIYQLINRSIFSLFFQLLEFSIWKQNDFFYLNPYDWKNI